MLPITEFAFAGIATFAATLGYACARNMSIYPRGVSARHQSMAMGTPGSPAMSGTAAENPSPTLKRKLEEDAESDTERPQKRNKTPPVEVDEGSNEKVHQVTYQPSEEKVATPEPQNVEAENMVADTLEPLVVEKIADVEAPMAPVTVIVEPSAPTPRVVQEVIAAVQRETSVPIDSAPQPAAELVVERSPATPEPVPALAPAVIERPMTPPAPSTPAKQTPKAFAAFASGSSPFMLGTPSTLSAPAWKQSTSVFAGSVIASPNDTFGSDFTKCTKKTSAIEDEPVQASMSALEKPPASGEEEETVLSELKGVKLFIKRGAREFTDGMFGHIKVLSHAESAKDRLLFRRDPLGQVSLNTGLQPTVRCLYDAKENTLRVILKEKIEAHGKEDIVIYAMKPGRAGKADFKGFAESLIANKHLTVEQSKAAAS